MPRQSAQTYQSHFRFEGPAEPDQYTLSVPNLNISNWYLGDLRNPRGNAANSWEQNSHTFIFSDSSKPSVFACLPLEEPDALLGMGLSSAFYLICKRDQGS